MRFHRMWILLMVLLLFSPVGDCMARQLDRRKEAVRQEKKAPIARLHDSDFRSRPLTQSNLPTVAQPVSRNSGFSSNAEARSLDSKGQPGQLFGGAGEGESGGIVFSREVGAEFLPENMQPGESPTASRGGVTGHGVESDPPKNREQLQENGMAGEESREPGKVALTPNSASPSPAETVSTGSSWSPRDLTDRENLPSTVQMFISVASISLVPAILLMTTCFIRIVVVLGILRQAIGLQQLPPTQVTTALALMMTFLIMMPTWKEIKREAIDPYSAEGSTMSWDEAWTAGTTPIKRFMWQQVEAAENENDFWVFYDYLPEEEKSEEPESYREVPLQVILPAFMISELKVAFLIGIQLLLPFLVLDIVVASLSNTMGLVMLPPTVLSLPLKLLLFVMVDGWNLVVTMLLNSFAGPV